MIPYTQAKNVTLKEVSGGGTSLVYQSLIMKTLPSTLEYSVGDLLSFDGMEIYALYSDGTDIYMKDVSDIATPSVAEGTAITEDMSEISFTYTDGKTDSVSYTIEVIGLPQGYTKRNYIAENATTAFSLGICWNESYKVIIDIHLISATNNNGRTLLGAASSATVTATGSNTAYLRAHPNNWETLQIGGKDRDGSTIFYSNTFSTPTLNKRITLELDRINNKIRVNDTEVEPTANNLAIYTKVANQYVLIAPYINGSKNVRLYGALVYNINGELTHDFKPCLNPSGVVGLYDILGGNFVSNSSWNTSG